MSERLDEATVRALRLVDVEAMQSARDNREYDPQAMPTVWYWPVDGYDSIKRVDAATIRALAADWLAMRAEIGRAWVNLQLMAADPSLRTPELLRGSAAWLEPFVDGGDDNARLDAVLKGGER